MPNDVNKTELIYQKNVYDKEADATVVDIVIHNGGSPLIVLDRTPFFPEGGGQPGDRGTIGGAKISDTYEKEGIVYHRCCCGKDKLGFSIGDKVHCAIDWDFRFQNMQRHCGEHILSGVFHSEFSGTNKGFHMGEDYMTVDIDFEDGDSSKISLKTALEAEKLANKIIWQNLPVTVKYFDTFDEADSYPHRKVLNIEEDISLVCVGDWENPADLVACCGTHPSSSGQVGLIKVYKAEKNKGMLRVYFDAGKKAMEQYDLSYGIVKDLADKHSSAIADLPDRMEKEEKKTQELREELSKLRDHITGNMAKELLSAMKRKQTKHPGKWVRLMAAGGAKTDDFARALKKIEDQITGVLVISFLKEKTILLQSDGETDCGAVVKKYAGDFNAKGGGSKKSARAKFENSKDMVAFTDAIMPK